MNPLSGYIPDFQTVRFRIPQCIRCTTSSSRAVTDAVGRAVNQMTVAGQKALTAGGGAAVDHLIDLRFNPRRLGLLGRRPAALVAAERQHQDSPDLRILQAQEDKFIVPQCKPAVAKSTVVSVWLPDTMLAKLEDAASKTGRSRNELVQMCIDYALARLEITEE